jgi:hypothetical protein
VIRAQNDAASIDIGAVFVYATAKRDMIGLFAFALVLIGCAGKALVPAPGVNTLPRNETAAVAEAAGVRVSVAPNRWSGTPENLPDMSTPLRVTIENGSNKPLRIRYDQFTLSGPAGFVETALAPFEVKGALIKPVFMPQFYYSARGFTLATYYRIFNREEDTYQPRHPWNYDEYTPGYNLRQVPLPTADMLARGIPEGVLQIGGDITGFLYFPRLVENVNRVTFTINLVDAESGKTFGIVRIPFLRT